MLPKDNDSNYQQLLAVLVINFLIAPLLGLGIGSLVASGLLFYSIILIVWNWSVIRRIRYAFVVVAALTLCLRIASLMGWSPSQGLPAELIVQGLFAIYLTASVLAIMKDLFHTKTVTWGTVQGGISVYFLLGYIWALLYGMVATVNAQAFSQDLVADASFIRAIHFSFTTLTTLGYGDIVPVSEIAVVLTNLEAVVGQMYPTVFISILVGGFLAQRNQN